MSSRLLPCGTRSSSPRSPLHFLHPSRYPQVILRRLGSEQYNALKQWCLNGRFFVWNKAASPEQENGLGQCLETSQLLEFGARPSGGGTFGCCSVCGAMLLDKEDTLCPQHSRGHCPDCGTQFAVDSKDKVKACQRHSERCQNEKGKEGEG